LYKIQHTTTSSKKTTWKLILNNNSLKLFFKIPNEFSTTLLLRLNCLLNNDSKIVQRTLPYLWSIINHGNNG
jgi:hypothetical protein